MSITKADTTGYQNVKTWFFFRRKVFKITHKLRLLEMKVEQFLKKKSPPVSFAILDITSAIFN